MKKVTYLIAGFLMIGLATGCKKEKQAEPAATAAAEPAIQVVADMVVKKDDVFQLFYTEDNSINFGSKSVIVSVFGKPESQEVIFNLPDDAYVGNLRFDVGENQSQEEMKINKIIIKVNDKEMEIGGADFYRYFIPSGYIKANDDKSSFRVVKENGVYDPFFYGNFDLVRALEKLNK